MIAYALGLWNYSVPLTGDQKVYVATSLEMSQHQSWLVPWLGGEHTYIKPPFVNWTLLLSWLLFGIGPWGTFFPSALAVALGAWVLQKISKILNNTQESPHAGLWYAVTFGTLTYGGSAQMEVWVTLFYLTSWLSILHFHQTKKTLYLYLAFLMAGLSALIKSPLYSVFWVLGYFLFLLSSRQLKLLFTPNFGPHFAGALLLGVFAGLSWFLYAAFTDFSPFWNLYVLHETFGKKGAPYTLPFTFWRDYLLSLLPITLPALMAMGIWSKNKFKFSQNTSPHAATFLVAASILPFCFFSIFPYRTETYLFILTPLIGIFLDLILPQIQQSKIFILSLKVNAAILALGTFLISLLLFLPGFIPAWNALLLLFSGVLPFILSGRRHFPRVHLIALLGVILSVRLAALSLGESDIHDLRAHLRENPHSSLVFLDEGKSWWNEIGLLSVAARQKGIRVFKLEKAQSLLNQGHTLVIPNYDIDSVLPRLLSNQSPTTPYTIKPWNRWNRGFLIPNLQDLKTMALPNTPEWKARFKREYKLIFLPRPHSPGQNPQD